MENRTSLLAALAALSLALPVGAHAQTTDPNVAPVISKVAAAYRKLEAFSTTLELTQGAGQKMVTRLVLQKPNLVKATMTAGTETRHFVADGKSYYADTSNDTKKYIKAPAADLKTAVYALAAERGLGVGLLPILLTSPSVEKEMIPGKPTSLKKAADAKVGGTDCEVIQAVMGGGGREFRYTFAFGKEDHLLRKLSIGPNTAGAAPMIAETYNDVSTKPVNSSAFVYTPAAGAVAMDPPKEPSMYDERLKPGAEPFPLKGVDLSGKKIAYADYKGKVLLVDFWATWCGPCVAELPNVLAAYKKYHPKGFDVVGISLDQADSRPKLESFIKEHAMEWPQIYDGKYWQADNAVAYGVRAIPFTLLVGKDGKIAAVGARGEALAPAIEAALAK